MSVFTNPSSAASEDADRYIAAVLGLLGDRDPLDFLRTTSDWLDRTVKRLSREELGAAEGDGKWSVREVVQHLSDSELVQGYRLRMVLAEDRPQLTGFDQDLWAARLHYERSDVQHALEQFRLLRRANLSLADGASDEELQRVGVHAERGEHTLEQMISLWAGHDLVHVRQIERICAIVER